MIALREAHRRHLELRKRSGTELPLEQREIAGEWRVNVAEGETGELTKLIFLFSPGSRGQIKRSHHLPPA